MIVFDVEELFVLLRAHPDWVLKILQVFGTKDYGLDDLALGDLSVRRRSVCAGVFGQGLFWVALAVWALLWLLSASLRVVVRLGASGWEVNSCRSMKK